MKFLKRPIDRISRLRVFGQDGVRTVAAEQPLKVLFHHIPKTAGSTFSLYLETLFSRRMISPARTPFGFEDGDIERYRLFRGHFPPSFLWNHFEEALWIVFLRDPVERVISQYENWNDKSRLRNYWKGLLEQNPKAAEAVHIAQTESLEAFVASDNANIRDVVHNYQTQHLTPMTSRDAWDDNLLADAKRHLTERFMFFGLAGDYERSMRLFSFQFGVPLSRKALRRVNVSRHKDKSHVTPRAIEMIREANRMDTALLDFAQRELDRRWGAMTSFRKAQPD